MEAVTLGMQHAIFTIWTHKSSDRRKDKMTDEEQILSLSSGPMGLLLMLGPKIIEDIVLIS